jgi:hypothetical protein
MGKDGYTVEVRENGKRLALTPIVDPFVNTFVHPKGLRAAVRVLFGRYEASVHVSADHATVEAVMELNPDYLGPPGSASRTAWNEQLHAALANLALPTSSPERTG